MLCLWRQIIAFTLCFSLILLMGAVQPTRTFQMYGKCKVNARFCAADAALAKRNRPETVPRLPGYRIDTFLKVFNSKPMNFRSLAAPDPARRSTSMLF